MSGRSNFSGSRLRDARTARGITAASLAERVGVSAGAMSQYENDRSDPSPQILSKMAVELSLPEAHFLRSPRESDPAPHLYRSRSPATKRARESAEVKQRWGMDIYDAVTQNVSVPKPQIDDFNFGPNPNLIKTEDIEGASCELRNRWGLGSGPIPNMVAALEAKGCLVMRFAFGSSDLNSFAQCTSSRAIVVLNSEEGSAVRGRFDAAHELGHIILHRQVDGSTARSQGMHKLMEQQAHRFASAFLFPERAFSNEVYSMTLDALIPVKRRWRTSMQMMIRRALDLHLINQDKYERSFRDLSRRGYRTHEPLDDELAPEVPTVLTTAIRLQLESGRMTRESLLYQVPLSATDIEILTQLPRGYLTSETWGQVLSITPIPNNLNTKQDNGRDASVIRFPVQKH